MVTIKEIESVRFNLLRILVLEFRKYLEFRQKELFRIRLNNWLNVT